MKPNELMIDDWVQVPSLIDDVEHYNAWCKVRQLRDCDLDVIGFKELKYNEIVPIPLTAEILEKNGFIKQSFDGWMLRTENYSIMWRIDYGESNLNIDSWSAYYGTFHKFGISFVHELQHALRLCNIEKEIDC